MIRKIFEEGSILPAFITVGLLKQELQDDVIREAPAVLIDGFPRNQDNLEEFEKQVGLQACLFIPFCFLPFVRIDLFSSPLRSNPSQIGPAQFMLHIECPEEVLVQRILARASKSGRMDDTEEITRRRIQGYLTETMPIVKEFQNNPQRHLFTVNGDQSVDKVFQEVEEAWWKFMDICYE